PLGRGHRSGYTGTHRAHPRVRPHHYGNAIQRPLVMGSALPSAGRCLAEQVTPKHSHLLPVVRGKRFMASPGEHTLTFLRGSGFLMSLVGVWDLMADESSQWPEQKGFLIFKETKITAV